MNKLKEMKYTIKKLSEKWWSVYDENNILFAHADSKKAVIKKALDKLEYGY